MLSETLEALLAAGATSEQLLAVVRVHEKQQVAAQEALREKWRSQKRSQRQMSRHVRECPPDIEGLLRTPADPSSPLMVSPSSLLVLDNTPPSYKPPSPSTATKSRGCRLPDDWHPRAEDGLDNLELAKFRDYWRAVPGQKGTKLDWDATWRNWLRTAGKSPTNAEPKATTNRWGKAPHEMTDAEREEWLAERRKELHENQRNQQRNL